MFRLEVNPPTFNDLFMALNPAEISRFHRMHERVVALVDKDANITERYEVMQIFDNAPAETVRDLPFHVHTGGPPSRIAFGLQDLVSKLWFFIVRHEDIDRARAEIMMLVLLQADHGQTGKFVRGDGDRAVLTLVKSWLQA